MQGLNLVVVKDDGEELGERRAEPSEDVVEEEGIKCPRQDPLLGGADQEDGLFLLIVVTRRQQERGGRVLHHGDGGRAEGRCRRGGGACVLCGRLRLLERHS